MSEYFPKPKSLGVNVKGGLDYATKTDLKNAAGVDISKLIEKIYLVSLKSEVDKLDIDKLEVPTALVSLRSNADKLDVNILLPIPVHLSKLSDVVKSVIVKKTEYDNMVKKRNTLPTNDTSNLFKEIDDNTKSNGTENKIIAHDHCNSILLPKNLKKFTGENFAARLAKANLASKNIVASVKKTNFDYKLYNGNKKSYFQ